MRYTQALLLSAASLVAAYTDVYAREAYPGNALYAREADYDDYDLSLYAREADADLDYDIYDVALSARDLSTDELLFELERRDHIGRPNKPSFAPGTFQNLGIANRPPGVNNPTAAGLPHDFRPQTRPQPGDNSYFSASDAKAAADHKRAGHPQGTAKQTVGRRPHGSV